MITYVQHELFEFCPQLMPQLTATYKTEPAALCIESSDRPDLFDFFSHPGNDVVRATLT